MNCICAITQRLRSIWQNRAVKQEIDEELRFHLEQRTADNIAAGMFPEEAAREARRRFGNLQCIREDCRDHRGTNFGGTVWQDVQFGLRMLWKNPGFTTIAVLTLALGIGINTSMFSALKLLLFPSLPFPEPDRLVRVLGKTSSGEKFSYHSSADFFEAREQSVAVENLSAFFVRKVNLSGTEAPPESVASFQVTANFFPCLGITPILGRVFAVQNEEPGQDQVVLLTRSFWMRRFGGDTNIVGRSLRIDGKSVTVLGVIPDSINSLFLAEPRDMVQPLVVPSDQRKDRENQWIDSVFGRLKPGVSLAQAQAEWNIISGRSERAKTEYRLVLCPLVNVLHQGTGDRIFATLLALTGFVLLIACTNLANLQLSRMVARSRELGIRAALGAGRGRLARQLLTESLVLSLLGGTLGIVFAIWGNHFLGSHLNANRTDFNIVIPIDRSVISFALLVTIAAGILIGTAPAWLMVRTDINPALKDGVRTSGSHSRHRLQNTLIVIEISMAALLLACTGELGLAILRESNRTTVWNPKQVMVGRVTLTGPDYDSYEKKRNFARRVEERVASLPGVKDASLCSGLPFEGCNFWHVMAEGQAKSAEQTGVAWNYVDQHFFKTVEMSLRQGRNFTSEEIEHASPVVIISQALAEKMWPGQDPIGKRLAWVSDNPDWWQVIGVVPNASDSRDFRGYRPVGGLESLSIIMRATSPPDVLASALRKALLEIDPNLPVSHFSSATKIMEEYDLNEQTIVGLIGAFGALGMLLATIGVYGVTSQLVSQRSNEFAIRMALGAQRPNVLWLVLRNGLRLSLVGGVLGIFGGIATLRVLNSTLPNLIDPKSATLLGLPATAWISSVAAAAILVGIALFSCYLPARRATQIDPMTVLRCE